MKKLMLFLFVGMFLISFASALEFDNFKYERDTTFDGKAVLGNELLTKYKPIEIENRFGLGETLFEGYLSQHDDSCGVNCESTIEISLTNDGVLIDDIYFETILEDESRIRQDIRSYQFYIKTDESSYSVDDFEYQCEGTGKFNLNGTEEQTCSNVKVGSHLEVEPLWQPYALGEEVLAGTYTIKLEAKKKSSRTVDWVIKTNGEWLEEWAIWGGSSLAANTVAYWKLDNNNFSSEIGSYTLSNSGTINTSGIIIDGRKLDGASDGLFQTSTDLNINYSTVAGWVNITNFAGSSTLISKMADSTTGSNLYELRVETSGKPKFLATRTGGTSFIEATSAISLNEWHQLAGVSNETGLYLYIDGQLNASVLNSNPVIGGTRQELTLGYDSPVIAGDRWFLNGEIDEVVIFNTSLTSEDISFLYNSGSPGSEQQYPFSTGTVTLNSPADSITSGSTNINFNATAEVTGGDTLVNRTLYVWYSNGTLFGTNTTTGLSGTTETAIDTIGGLLDGESYLWNKEYCDNGDGCGFAIANFSFSIDTSAPILSGIVGNGTINYGNLIDNKTINFTATDTNLDSCWIGYNNTNTTYSCSTGVQVNTTFPLVLNLYNATIYANDSVGNLASQLVNWNYWLFENSQNFNAETVETSSESFLADITYNQSTFDLITGTLHYNGTEYTGTKSASTPRFNFSTLVAVPNVEQEYNVSFYWTIGLVNDSGTLNINLTNYNQTVNVINMSLCGNPHTVPFINFSVYDEDTGNELNASFQSTFTYSAIDSSSENTFSYSNITQNRSEFDFCMDPSTSNYTLNTNIEVSATGYSSRFFTWQDLLVYNTTVEKDLYLLNSSGSTSFIVQVIDAGNNKQTGVQVEIERFNPGLGIWTLQEVLTTNFEGKTIAHIATEDADYRFRVYQSGVSIYNSSSTKISCESLPCTVKLIVPGDIPTGLETLDDLTTSIAYNENTNIFTFTYTDNSATFSSGEINVYKFNAGNSSDNALVCTSSSASSSAVISCDISTEVNGTYKAVGSIIRTDSGTNIVEIIYGYKGDTIYNQVGEDGVLWAFFLFMGVVMVGVFRPSLAILASVVGVVMLSALNIISIGITAIVSIIALAIVLLIQVRKE